MPTYEYACKACGEHVEVVQSFKDEPLTACPNCGGELRKVFGAIGIAFKGSGFYKTDSRSQEGKKAKEKEPTEKAPTEPKEKAASTGGGSGDKAKSSSSDSKSAASS